MFFANTSCGRISCILDTPVDSRLTVKYFSAVRHVRIASDFFSSNSSRGRPKKGKKWEEEKTVLAISAHYFLQLSSLSFVARRFRPCGLDLY